MLSIPWVCCACQYDTPKIFILAEIFLWHNYHLFSQTWLLSTQRFILMRSFSCNYFSQEYHTTYHFSRSRRSLKLKTTIPTLHLLQKSRLSAAGCAVLRRMEGRGEERKGLKESQGDKRWREKGKRKGQRLLRQPGAHMWLSFAYVASLQGEGLCKHKQQRGCSWSREAAACLPRPLYSKQWIKWRTGLWQCNRDPGSSEKPFFRTFISLLLQYLPHGETHSFPFLLFWKERKQ